MQEIKDVIKAKLQAWHGWSWCKVIGPGLTEPNTRILELIQIILIWYHTLFMAPTWYIHPTLACLHAQAAGLLTSEGKKLASRGRSASMSGAPTWPMNWQSARPQISSYIDFRFSYSQDIPDLLLWYHHSLPPECSFKLTSWGLWNKRTVDIYFSCL